MIKKAKVLEASKRVLVMATAAVSVIAISSSFGSDWSEPIVTNAENTMADYEKQMKAGVNPVFKAKNIDLKYETDCWN